jgi:hypothetical protein
MSGRSRRLGAVTAGLVVVLGVVALAVLWVSGEEGGDETVALAPPTGGVVAIPGFAPRFQPATATIDEAPFVFGGYPAEGAAGFNDAVLVAPDFASATRVPAGPFDPPLYAPQALGVDGRVLVVGTACANQRAPEDSAAPICEPGSFVAAVLETRDGRHTWRRIEVPEPVRPQRWKADGGFVGLLGTTSDGRAIVSFGFRDSTTYWTFDLDHDDWQPIEGPGVTPERACTAGDTLVVLATGPLLVHRDLQAGGAWVRSASVPRVGNGERPPDLVCLGDRAALMDPAFAATLRLYSLTERMWSTPSAPPRSVYFRDRVWTGRELVFLPTEADHGAPGMAYAPATDSWRTITGFPSMTRGAIWSGTAVVGYSEPVPIGERDGKPLRAPAGVFRVDV